jgi:hypothetical protein
MLVKCLQIQAKITCPTFNPLLQFDDGIRAGFPIVFQRQPIATLQSEERKEKIKEIKALREISRTCSRNLKQCFAAELPQI